MKNLIIYLTLCILLLFVTGMFNNFLDTEILIYNFYAEQLAKEQIEQLLEIQQKWAWVGYAIVPLLILIRSNLVALSLSVGNFFYTIDEVEHPKFSEFFRIALLGEFVLVLVGFFKFIYFALIKTDFTLEDLQQYYPLSYINFLDLEKLEPWLVYPLQTINLFEISYFFVLVYGLHKLLKNKYSKSFEMVTVSYGTGLVIWLGLVMFLMLNNT